MHFFLTFFKSFREAYWKNARTTHTEFWGSNPNRSVYSVVYSLLLTFGFRKKKREKTHEKCHKKMCVWNQPSAISTKILAVDNVSMFWHTSLYVLFMHLLYLNYIRNINSKLKCVWFSLLSYFPYIRHWRLYVVYGNVLVTFSMPFPYTTRTCQWPY